MRSTVAGLLFILFLGSCYRLAQDPTFDMSMVLPPDTMVSLLCDLHTADGVVSANKNKKISTGHLSTEYYEAILSKRGINKATFDESMRYYAYYNEELDKIYEKVITNLSRQESMAVPAKPADTVKSRPLP